MITIEDFRTRLQAYITSQVDPAARVLDVKQLAGGASRDTWALDIAMGPETQKLVLRRDLGGEIQDEALTRGQEFALLEVAHTAGVMVPRPRWLCLDPAFLDTPFFVMDRIDGESVGRRVLKEPGLAAARAKLPAAMGEQLARIHAIDPYQRRLSFLPRPDPETTPAVTALRRTREQLSRLDEPHPALELAARWLEQRAPVCQKPVLCHGDFRIGNLMVGPEGLRGVFDWEFSHIGDAAEELAWPCVRSWRFGNDRQKLGGIGDPEAFFEAYEGAGGSLVDRQAVAYWEIMGNFRWAVGCIQQANRHLGGQEPNLEFASLGRRTAEMELEVLNLIEAAA